MLNQTTFKDSPEMPCYELECSNGDIYYEVKFIPAHVSCKNVKCPCDRNRWAIYTSQQDPVKEDSTVEASYSFYTDEESDCF